MYDLVRRILFCLPAETAHDISLKALKWAPRFLFAKPKDDPVHALGLIFPNRVGIAAGLDKNGDYIDALAKLGVGFIEVGTVTPKPQVGNPKPRLFRLPKQRALINRMGFNNKGVDYLVQRLQAKTFQGIVGVNIGKNKQTPLDRAADDYLSCLRKVYPYASYITINISSPNTPDLRKLQTEEYLANLICVLLAERTKLTNSYQRKIPLVIKLSPDLTDEELLQIVNVIKTHPVEGVIATNTTVARDHISSELLSGETGGLSGAPLKHKSTQVLAKLAKQLPESVSLIGVGGIMSRQDTDEKFAAGAKLIQLYTGLIYQGPGLICELIGKSEVTS